MSMRTPTTLIFLAAFGLAAAPFALAAPQWFSTGAPLHLYEGAGTIVTNFDLLGNQVTIADNGAVQCRDQNADQTWESGTGGVCITFEELARTRSNAIYVQDSQTADSDLAFQVCVDMDGDGVCGTPRGIDGPTGGGAGYCRDFIFFSHGGKDSSGGGSSVTRNPFVLPPPEWIVDYVWSSQTGMGCEQNGGFPGYVVILCAGLHGAAGTATHSHSVSHGVVQPVFVDSHFDEGGDFCGGPTAAKAYTWD